MTETPMIERLARAGNEDETPWLHIRPQNWEHDKAEIVGTVHGLQILRSAVDDAILGKSGTQTAFATDGEGYPIDVRRSSTVSGLSEPFYLEYMIDRCARSRFAELLSHHRLIARQNLEALNALRWCRANGNPHLKVTNHEDD